MALKAVTYFKCTGHVGGLSHPMKQSRYVRDFRNLALQSTTKESIYLHPGWVLKIRGDCLKCTVDECGTPLTFHLAPPSLLSTWSDQSENTMGDTN